MKNRAKGGREKGLHTGTPATRAIFSESGFTIVEMIIALFITALVATAIYTVYTNYYRQSNIQEMSLESQQNARVALNLMERELMNAGYATGTPIITEATPSTVEFKYTDPSDSNISSTSGKRLHVRYWVQSVGGVQYLVKRTDNLTDGVFGSTEPVIPNIKSLEFEYYNINGEKLTSTATPAEREAIMFITVRLVTETSENLPGTSNKKDFMVETHVRLRNIGIGQVATDTTPPAAPTGVQVRDPGQCGRLKVKWNLNSEGDISGYKVYYGTTSGDYTGVVSIPMVMLTRYPDYSCSLSGSTIECTIFPQNPTITSALSDGSITATYHVAVKAYDNSLNHSGYSSEVSGNPSPSNPTFDTGSNDSTINPVKPMAVTGLTGADGPSDNQVNLSWDTYDTSGNPDVVGFRIYRSEDPFGTYPIDPNDPAIDWIAGEPGSGKTNVINPTDTAFTDLGPGLSGCKKYYYAIAPVNCDTALVTDEGGDPASKKYVQTDYDATCGDGTNTCTAGTGFSAVAGSDTAPPDGTKPSPPSGFDARAGWKRVAISFTQPSDSDISHTCVYGQEGTNLPNFQGTKDALGCYDVDNPGIRLYESDGHFDAVNPTPPELAAGVSKSFWHNSMTSATSVPSLLETGTYSYRALSFDLCGNASDVTAAQATTTLCGEDPIGKPPAPVSLTATGCNAPVSLTWPGVSSDIGQPSSPANPWDLAGYRILRSTSATDWSSAAVLNPVPLWGTGTVTYPDNTLTEGSSYYYRVIATDCPYEKDNPSAATIRSDMGGILSYVQTGPVSPGKIDRDEKCPGAGSCTKDNHREVLTGVTIDNTIGNGTGESVPSSNFKHTTVTMFFENTSAGKMTITGLNALWVNSAAILDRVFIGGGRSGVGRTEININDSASVPITGNPPYTMTSSNPATMSVQINPAARYVPITLVFEDSSANPVDMRDDQLLLTLKVTNDSTGSVGCDSYLTVSLAPEGIAVPFGPSITATQQNKPSSPTYSYAVPGSTGANTVPYDSYGTILVDANMPVTISANIAGNTTDASTGTKVPISTATLYYKVTDKTVVNSPTTGFTAVAMTNTGGNTWSGSIPASDGFRVWYYIVAIDNDGNFDRDPEIDYGTYVYDQKVFDVCDVTPSAPTALYSSVFGMNVTLNWTAPTTYTNGTPINLAKDTIKYDVYRKGTPIVYGVPGTTYTNTVSTAGVYSYNVRATNSCSSPGPNISGESNVAANCVGLTAQALLEVSPTTIYRGHSYQVRVLDCFAVNDPYGLTVEKLNFNIDFNGFKNESTVGGYLAPIVPETGPATGLFPVTIQTTDNVSDTGKLLVGKTDTITVTYPYAFPPTKTINVVPDPCTNTPEAPASLTGAPATGQNVDLSWSSVTLNTDGSPMLDLKGYRVYERVCAKDKPNCTGSDVVADWFLRTTVGPSTTATTISADQGSLNTRIYYFKIRAIDTCPTTIESTDSPVWNEG